MSPGARNPAAGGDRGGLASFFEANKSVTLRYIRGQGVPAADVEDVNQKTWLSLHQLWERRGAPETDEHARNLMFQVAHRRVVDYWRAADRRPRTEAWEPDLHDHLTCSGAETGAETGDRIWEDLTGQGTRGVLTHRQETALRLVYREGWSQQEAAAQMHITQNALEKLLSRAKDAIRQAQQVTPTRTEEGTR